MATNEEYLPTTAVRYRPAYATFLQFPAVCFTLVLVTDFIYWQTAFLMWQYFSSWLLFAGLLIGGIGALVAIVESFFISALHRPSWELVIGSIVVFILAVLNSLVHASDGWTAVVPWGIVLSVLTVLVMLLIEIENRTRALSRRMGVTRNA